MDSEGSTAQSVDVTDDEHYLKRELYELVKSDPSIFEFLQAGSLDGIWYWDLDSWHMLSSTAIYCQWVFTSIFSGRSATMF